MSNSANEVSDGGNAGTLTSVVTLAEVAAVVEHTAAQVVPMAVASIAYSIDSNGHLIRSRDGVSTDVGRVRGQGGARGSLFWGAYANIGAMPNAGSGVNPGDYAFNQLNSSLYAWSLGSWQNAGSLKGTDGAPGSQGPKGEAGAIGPQGPQGTPGAVGATGSQGPAGSVGPQGPQGLSVVGATGATGPKGDGGAAGPAGAKGDTGAAGPQGPSGVDTAIDPITYDAPTKTIAIKASGATQAGSMSAVQADQLAKLNASKTLCLLNQTFATAAIGLLGSPTTVTYTVSGAAVGMGAIVNPRSSTPFGPLLYAWVSAPNTISVEVRPIVAIAASSIAIDIHVFANPS